MQAEDEAFLTEDFPIDDAVFDSPARSADARPASQRERMKAFLRSGGTNEVSRREISGRSAGLNSSNRAARLHALLFREGVAAALAVVLPQALATVSPVGVRWLLPSRAVDTACFLILSVAMMLTTRLIVVGCLRLLGVRVTMLPGTPGAWLLSNAAAAVALQLLSLGGSTTRDALLMLLWQQVISRLLS